MYILQVTDAREVLPIPSNTLRYSFHGDRTPRRNRDCMCNSIVFLYGLMRYSCSHFKFYMVQKRNLNNPYRKIIATHKYTILGVGG